MSKKIINPLAGGDEHIAPPPAGACEAPRSEIVTLTFGAAPIQGLQAHKGVANAGGSAPAQEQQAPASAQNRRPSDVLGRVAEVVEEAETFALQRERKVWSAVADREGWITLIESAPQPRVYSSLFDHIVELGFAGLSVAHDEWVVLDLLGIKGLNIKGQPAVVAVVDHLAKEGIELDGRRLYAAIVSSSTKGAQLPLVTERVRSIASAMFPEAKDAIRFSSLFTPCEGLIAGTGDEGFPAKVRIMVVKDDDPRFHVGDGVGVCSPRVARAMGVRHSRQWQVRGLIYQDADVPASWTAVKGTFVVSAALGRHCDLVIPESMLKGAGKKALPKGEVFAEKMILGVVSVGERRVMRLSHQVTMYRPKESGFWKGVRLFHDEFVEKANRFAAEPWTVLDGPGGTRAVLPDGHIEQMALARAIARLAKDKPAIRPLLKANGLIEHVARAASATYTRWMVGDVSGVLSLMAACDNTLPDFVVVVHPDDWRRFVGAEAAAMAELPREAQDAPITADTPADAEAILIRMPHDGVSLKVKVYLRRRIVRRDTGSGRITSVVRTRGSMFVNGRTPAPLAGDFDGDYYGLVALTNEAVKSWHKEIANPDLDGEKKRQAGQPASTLGWKVHAMVGPAIGSDPISMAAATIAWVESARQAATTKKQKALLGELRVRLSEELQKAVDAAKHDSVVDFDFLALASEAARKHVNEFDMLWRNIGQRKIRTHLPADKAITVGRKTVVARGELALAHELVSSKVGIGAHMRELSERLPALHIEKVSNKWLLEWLPKPPANSVGARFAEERWAEYLAGKKALEEEMKRTKREWSALFLNGELPRQLAEKLAREESKKVSDLLWKHSLACQTAKLPPEERINAALWQWHAGFSDERSTGLPWRYGFVQEIYDLLDKYADEAAARPRAEGGTLGVISQRLADQYLSGLAKDGKPAFLVGEAGEVETKAGDKLPAIVFEAGFTLGVRGQPLPPRDAKIAVKAEKKHHQWVLEWRAADDQMIAKVRAWNQALTGGAKDGEG